MTLRDDALKLHLDNNGKIEVKLKVPLANNQDLSLAYTPGVAQPCLEIQKDPDKSYELTRRWNMCAVITDGSAVLGLGDIGPEAGMPVMEGKCVLFKSFGDVDAFPLCVKTKDVDEFVNTVLLLCGNFGGINLEDTTNPGRIWNTDKKFLYGFWRECFDVKQQLFLIFVRAEPMLMGGGAVGQTPPQLGGRAMALVWRDPINRSTQTLSPSGSGAKGGNGGNAGTYTTGGAAPHRTRILFYRQFD